MLCSRKTSNALILMIASVVVSTSAFGGRGNDFGNGGDPVREVFNAARVFAQDVAKQIEASELNSVSDSERAAWSKHQANIQKHLSQVEHRWSKNDAVKNCARMDARENEVMHLSYKHCRSVAPNAALATSLLLNMAWRAVADLKDWSKGNVVIEAVIMQWEQESVQAVEKAKTFSVERPSVAGKWKCQIGSADVMAEVRQDNILVLDWPVTAHGKANKVRFSSFLTLNANRSNFQANGMLTLSRPAAGEHSNVVYDPTCNYPYAVEFKSGASSDALILEMRSAGKPEIADGCGAFHPSMYSTSCTAVDP
jgi:hypothetical protein